MERLIGVLGVFVILFIAWLLSNNKKKIHFRIVIVGLLLQVVLATFILKTSIGQLAFEGVRVVVTEIISLSDQGAIFVFGESFQDHYFAFRVLPTIIFVSAMSAVLFYLGIIQLVIRFLAWIMKKAMDLSGSESLVTAANIFIGQTEAPLIIRHYLPTMTRSEIMCMMTSGMATVAGGVLAAYVSMGISAGHLMAASLMAAPGALVIAKLMVPEQEKSVTYGSVKLDLKSNEPNILSAACTGASDGVKLAINVAAMLIAFISIVALVNLLLGCFTPLLGFELTIQKILGWICQPIALLMGIPWEDALKVGQLIGEKTVINEFFAYTHLAEFIKNGEISQRSAHIVTYALCGFANFSSVAIQIGGIGALVPEKRIDFAKLGFRALIGGSLAAFMSACIASVLI